MPEPPWKKARRDAAPPVPLIQYLVESRGFHNTESWRDMVQAYSLDEYASARCDVRATRPQAPLSFEGISTAPRGTTAALAACASGAEDHWFYDTLREEQNHKWAEEKLKKGVRLAKEKKNSEALKYYEQALQLCPRHADTLVARGALLANQGKLEEAACDLHMALRVDDQVANGRQYLEMVRRKQSLAAMHTTTNVRSYESSFAPPPRATGPSSLPPSRRPPSPKRSPVPKGNRSFDGDRYRKPPAPSATETAAAMSTLEEEEWVRSKRTDGEMSEEQLRGLLERKSDKKGKKKREKKQKKDKKSKKKKKHKSSSRKMSGGAGSSSGHSSDEAADEEAAHPILSRTKHELWG